MLAEHSTYHRAHLKERLFRAGIKQRVCELCGQGEIWNGARMSLILDHVNGVADDNRIENLRIVCANCNATLDTHCGRQNRLRVEPTDCLCCGVPFRPRYPTQRYCSRYCGIRARGGGQPLPHLRKVERPPYTHLLREVRSLGYSGTGRRYGVSDNAIRKWIRQYERELLNVATPAITSGDGPVNASRGDLAAGIDFPDPVSIRMVAGGAHLDEHDRRQRPVSAATLAGASPD